MTLSRAKSITSDEAYTPYGVYRKAGEVGESVRYAPSMRCERIVLWRGSPRRAVASGFTHRSRTAWPHSHPVRVKSPRAARVRPSISCYVYERCILNVINKRNH
jgi:hypothetical protein